MLTSSRVSLTIRARIRFSVWLDSECAHIFLLLSVVTISASEMTYIYCVGWGVKLYSLTRRHNALFSDSPNVR